ncbi:MAG TPA: DNA polymerase domain-containing protein [Anaerolineales bacterium]|nr:DNA polymerase domain-containing protein [Anaerolineales bacterium]
MKKYTGWLFDLYEHQTKGVVLWLIGEDGKRYSFHQDFETIFYASGSAQRLHELGVFLRKGYSRENLRLERVTKEDLFAGPQDVMGIAVSRPDLYKTVFKAVYRVFSDLIFYDVDIPLTVRYAAAHDVFMMARCEVVAEDDNTIVHIHALDTLDDLDPKLPRLRILTLKPDTDPSHAFPQYLVATFRKSYLRISMEKPPELINLLNAILVSFDPDVIRTHFGDAWLFPYLREVSKKYRIPFNPNRDVSMPVLRRREISFFNYGQAHYRAPQVHLRGRWHVDLKNCMTYNQYQLIGAIEQTRLSSLPLQEVARRSPGAAIASMQNLTALKRGTLVPYQHQKGEIPKTFHQFYQAARGGLIFQPAPGIFQNVAILDFSSKMASIMIKYNVSPETVVRLHEAGEGLEISELGVKILSRPGLIPQTLRSMRDKRLSLKRRLKSMDKNDPKTRGIYHRYKAVTNALKWLTVVCYGRLGFANSIFGRLNAHEVVSHLSRKVITDAKFLVEARGFDVLHAYVDSLFVSRADASQEDFQTLANEIEQATGLPMEFENVYSWFAFLSSRQNPRIPVANRFYGIAENGEHKIRGLAVRRADTCKFVTDLQLQIIRTLAKESDPIKLMGLLPEIIEITQEKLDQLKNRIVPLRELTVTQTLSRELNNYSVLSPLAVAARQLKAQGKTIKMGQQLKFIYIRGGPGVHAWDLPVPPDPTTIDITQYKELILRAVHEVLQPLNLTEKTLRDWLFNKARYSTSPGLIAPGNLGRSELPLFNDLKHVYVDNF